MHHCGNCDHGVGPTYPFAQRTRCAAQCSRASTPADLITFCTNIAKYDWCSHSRTWRISLKRKRRRRRVREYSGARQGIKKSEIGERESADERRLPRRSPKSEGRAMPCALCACSSVKGPARLLRRAGDRAERIERSSRLLWGAAARRIAGSHKIIGKRRLASLRVARNRNAGR